MCRSQDMHIAKIVWEKKLEEYDESPNFAYFEKPWCGLIITLDVNASQITQHGCN